MRTSRGIAGSLCPPIDQGEQRRGEQEIEEEGQEEDEDAVRHFKSAKDERLKNHKVRSEDLKH